MKEWKVAIAQRIVEDWNSSKRMNFFGQNTDRVVKFNDVAKDMGYNHIDRGDIRDIMLKVTKLEPQLRPVRFVADSQRVQPTESAWDTLYFTDLDFDDAAAAD